MGSYYHSFHFLIIFVFNRADNLLRHSPKLFEFFYSPIDISVKVWSFLDTWWSLDNLCIVWQVINVYEPRYESAAAYWPFVHRNIILALLIKQIALIGLFSVKKAVASTPFLLPLPCFTIIFHLYCCQKFLPAFKNYPLEVTSPTFIPSVFRIVCRSR
jgi:hypothetical protein